ncbi:aminoglycoside phosphotransferase family protein [Calothrix sp. UHCC 0171]|uniref:phosphotransferase enzyme family protein n=1 Tax=Calothrix sp. UHCC 0171 TaxID=3110245 RepID=UPI002B20D0B0|nr:aminoglycoside phosphotransferase family protein [Calothrix sp. UHCC 0171]MEA5573587.1 aminoglycoside phosphotransferase family protein [Calothrix sp. UHCC 0171]
MMEEIKIQGTDYFKIAEQFALNGKITEAKAFGSGNINDTYLIKLDTVDNTDFILQRINHYVFPQPQLVMQNMRMLTEYAENKLQNIHLDRRWQVPHVLLTKDGFDHYTDVDGSFWRAISFIQDSQTFDTIQNIEHSQEVGYALGMFHYLIGDLSPEKFADTLPGFHITPTYLQQYEEVLPLHSNTNLSAEVKYCLKFVSDRQKWADVLENAKAENKLPLRLMHGDPKINNVMFDTSTNKAVSVIDLDTVKPGLIHYDIGDCLRSACNPAGEEVEDWEGVYFDTDLSQGILQGYLCVAKAFLTENDYLYMYDAIRLITFELGLRFFTDYLAGNVYFKIKYPEHNLLRALVQFKLAESIESQANTINQIIADLQA